MHTPNFITSIAVWLEKIISDVDCFAISDVMPYGIVMLLAMLAVM